MIPHETTMSPWVAVPAFAAGGVLLGTVYFASLRRGVELAVARRAWTSYALLALARIAAAALLFAFALHWGLVSLLAAFTGFLGTRHLAVRAAQRLR